MPNAIYFMIHMPKIKEFLSNLEFCEFYRFYYFSDFTTFCSPTEFIKLVIKLKIFKKQASKLVKTYTNKYSLIIMKGYIIGIGDVLFFVF